VTIPYKEAVIPFLDALDAEARLIGAVNTICLTPEGTRGYNTDVIGFRESLRPLLRPSDRQALILGTGGASKAVARALETLGITYRYVSRTPEAGQLAYGAVHAELLREYPLLIQCTPLGTFPDTERAPELPYEALGPRHLLYDLIYNPALTTFLRRGQERGARIKNGLEMLQIQAERAWELWNR
jgi:shikimate dehydrogenase